MVCNFLYILLTQVQLLITIIVLITNSRYCKILCHAMSRDNMKYTLFFA